MGKYRKKPVVVEAVQWTGANISQIKNFMLPQRPIYFLGDKVGIGTEEGLLSANPSDWIIKGVKGEFYPCKPDIFEATYEKIDEDARCLQCGERLVDCQGHVGARP